MAGFINNSVFLAAITCFQLQAQYPEHIMQVTVCSWESSPWFISSRSAADCTQKLWTGTSYVCTELHMRRGRQPSSISTHIACSGQSPCKSRAFLFTEEKELAPPANCFGLCCAFLAKHFEFFLLPDKHFPRTTSWNQFVCLGTMIPCAKQIFFM